MDSFELNKIVGAILGTLLFVMGVGFLAEAIYAPSAGPGPGYDLPSGEAQTAQAGAKEAPKVESIAVRLAKANVDKGKNVAKKCQSCHNFAEGAGAKVGPDLYNVVGRPIAGKEGFAYSDALKKHDPNGQADWTYQKLDEWLTNPKKFAPGTKMTFNGIDNPQDRADLIAYLHTLSTDPVPFPKPEPQPAAQSSSNGGNAGSGDQASANPADQLATLLQNASAEKGAKDVRVCQACHNFKEGAGAKIGPDLYNIVGRPIASKEGYSYSDALKKHDPDGKTVWTFQKLDEWLTKPKDFAPGTKMSFAGISDAKKRADILVYLHTLSNNPEPLPTPGGQKGTSASDQSGSSGQSGGANASGSNGGAADNAASSSSGGSTSSSDQGTQGSSDTGNAAASAQTANTSESSGSTAASGSGGADSGFSAMLASASADKGAKDIAVCKACHSFTKGGPNKVGPNLYDIVGRPIAGLDSYKYSPALQKLDPNGNTDWTYKKLDEWLTKPRDFAKGTKMTFAGISSEKKRADIIAYLHTLSDNPAPLPGQ